MKKKKMMELNHEKRKFKSGIWKSVQFRAQWTFNEYKIIENVKIKKRQFEYICYYINHNQKKNNTKSEWGKEYDGTEEKYRNKKRKLVSWLSWKSNWNKIFMCNIRNVLTWNQKKAEPIFYAGNERIEFQINEWVKK